MLIRPDGRIREFTIEDHLQQGKLVYRDRKYAIYLSSDKNHPFHITEGKGKDMYIDLFALHFGQKEQVHRRTARGLVPIQYGCARCERDRILYLPVEHVVDVDTRHTCVKGCQYYSPPVGVKGKYVLNCILSRYRAFEVLDFKGGLTLEEVGRIYGCTRERIRQIEEQAIRKMRHSSRLGRLEVFWERIADYRDYYVSAFENTA